MKRSASELRRLRSPRRSQWPPCRRKGEGRTTKHAATNPESSSALRHHRLLGLARDRRLAVPACSRPPKGDYVSVPVNPQGRTVADAWDPAKDEAAGEQCRAYGAAGLMRMPTRLHITWQDDTTLKLETDAGTQTRHVHVRQTAAGSGGDWQGSSVASWDQPRAIFASPIPNRGGPQVRGGSLKVVTTNMKPGYLRKNGVPYSANAVMTEYFDRLDVPSGDSLLVITTEIVDPEYLTTPYWTSPHFKRVDATGWNPTACAAR